MLLSFSYISRIYHILFVLLAFFIPLFRLGASYVIVALFVLWLIEADFRRKMLRIKKEKWRMALLALSLFYLLFLVGMIYTKDFTGGLSNLRVKLPLLVFPLLLSSLDKEYLSKGRMHHIFIAFISATVLISLINLGRSFSSYLQTGDSASFYYSGITYGLHSSYFALFECFSIALVIYFFFRLPLKTSWLVKLGLAAVVLFLMVFTILLSSKTGIIALVGVFVLTSFWIWWVLKKPAFSLSFAFISLSVIAILFYTFDQSNARMKVLVTEIKSKPSENISEGKGNARMLIWTSALQKFSESPFIGFGTGDVYHALEEQYQDNNYHNLSRHKLNAHNSYLETSLAIGALGLLMLLAVLLLPLFFAFRSRYLLLLTFLLLISMNFMTESMLKRQDGVVFFAFFLCLLVFGWKELLYAGEEAE